MNRTSQNSPLPTATKHASFGRLALALSIAAAFLAFAAFGLAAVPAHAADDSNAGRLAQTPTVTPQELASALSALSQGSNSTQLQQLLSQFQSELNSGNYKGAASTLVQLKGLSSADPNGVPQSLNALLQSLTVGSNGASIDANLLASLLRPSQGASSGSQQRLSVDMQTLANLMQYVNSTMASQLLQNSQLLSQNAFAGNGGANPNASPIKLPGASSLPGLSIPSIVAPSLSIGGAGGGPPAVPFTAFAIPLLVAAAVAVLFFYRGRIIRLIGTQSLPGVILLRGARGAREADAGAVPTDPRKRIEFYFGRAVRLMARRGVPKLSSETHREFSANCESKPERPQVSTISSLYEKAKFSGQDVESPEADDAAAAFFAMGKDEG
jgi:hypothetical protein